MLFVSVDTCANGKLIFGDVVSLNTGLDVPTIIICRTITCEDFCFSVVGI